MKRLLILFAILFVPSLHATTFYATQSGGTSAPCTTGVHNEAWVEDSANWGMGAGQIHPGDTLRLCGTWVWTAGQDGLRPRVDTQPGTAGNPITIDATGATFHAPYFNVFGLNVNTSAYIIVDGGTYGNTDNGSSGSFTYQHLDGRGIYADHCDNCEIKNVTVANGYQHTSMADHNGGIYAISYSGANFSIHDSTFHDNGIDLNLIDGSYGSGSTPGGYHIYNNTFSNYVWAMDCGSSSGTISSITINNNHFGGNINWDMDNSSGTVHKNGVHCYSNPPHKVQTISIYNNLIDGNWGDCCLTTPGFFLEASDQPWSDPTGTAYVYNNILAPSHLGDDPNNGYINVGTGTNNVIVNNTIIGTNRATGIGINLTACCLAINPTNMIVENNVIEGVTTLISNVLGSGTGNANFTACDYHTYGDSTSNDGWHLNTTTYPTFAGWKSGTGCDSHATASLAGPLANLSSAGVPSAGFAGITAGINLTPLGIATLNKDYAGTARPGTGAWDTGAYVYGGAVGPYTLTINSTNPPSGVSITATADVNGKTAGTTPTSFVYAAAANPAITAAATVSSWTGCTSPSGNVCTQTAVASSATITANYAVVPPVTLTINSSNPASGVTIVCTNDTDTTPFTHSYSVGTAVTCTAPGTVGLNTFQSWTNCPSPAGAVCNFPAIATDTTITANYGGGVGPGCQLSGSTFSNISLPSQAGTFTVTYTVQPSQNNMDGVLGFSMGAASAYSNLAAISRFHDTGIVDAWDNSGTPGYKAVNSFPYLGGVIYNLRAVINAAAGTYDLYVRAPGGSEVQIASGYTFRTGAEPLNNWAVTSEVGYLVGCGVSIQNPITHTLRAPVIVTGGGQ